MLIKLIDAKEGDILNRDVMLPSNRPIMFKETVLTAEHIQALSAFLIKSIDIIKPDRETIIGTEVESDQDATIVKKDFISSYNMAVAEFKRLFIQWQSGIPTHVSAVREIIIPLIQSGNEEQMDFFLYKESKPADYIFHHAISVGIYAAYIAKKLGLSIGEVNQIAVAGTLCDVGMARIPNNILMKKEKLSTEEYREVKKHPIIGYKMLLETSSLSKNAQLAILQHHERLDGSGYPRGDKAEKIHLYSRIIAVADTYHALTTDKTYRSGVPPFQVLEMIRYGEFGKFDLIVVDVLMTSIAQISIGSKVLLSNYLSGEVIFMNQQNITRPIVKLIDSEDMINLEQRRDLFIEEIYS